MSSSADEIVLEARAITKRYPGTMALDDVTFRVHRNHVNVLIGENGAGKSTLMRILAGVETADAGQLLLEGTPIRVRSPREAADLGITIVHQELSVLSNLDVSENIFAGRERVKAMFFSIGREDTCAVDELPGDLTNADCRCARRSATCARSPSDCRGCAYAGPGSDGPDAGRADFGAFGERDGFSFSRHRRSQALRRDHHLYFTSPA